MRREPAFLNDIFVSCSRILSMMQGVSQAELLGNDVLQAALLHHLTVIGEASNRLPEDLRRRYPQVAWNEIIAVRNRIVHVYFGLDWKVLWATTADDIPLLQQVVTEMLAHECGELPSESSE
jgi:uncharacterized protein with HEPN domain